MQVCGIEREIGRTDNGLGNLDSRYEAMLVVVRGSPREVVVGRLVVERVDI